LYFALVANKADFPWFE